MPTTIRNTNDPTRPDYLREEVELARPDLDLIHDLLAGTRRIHAVAKARGYLRQWTDEKDAVYEIRSRMEQVYEGLGRTLSASTGMLFATPPVITYRGQEATLRADLDNIDAAGTRFEVAAKRFTEWAIRDGYALILVDHPSAPDVVVTAANEADLNLRPTWAFYERASVCNWRTEVQDNREVLTLLTLHEGTTVNVGAFGVESVDRYRVLALVDGVATWTLWEAPKDRATSWTVDSAGVFTDRAGRPFDELPVAIGYAGRTDAALTAVPPLLGVAWANLGHWQQASNLRFYREVAAFPQPTVNGQLAQNADGTPGTLRVGPMVVVHLTTADAKFQFTELQGSALEQVEAGVKAKEEQIAALGMSFLSRDKRQTETAEAKRMDATAENSTLATAGQGCEDAMNLALGFHARYRGIAETEAPTVQLNRNFERTALSAQELGAIAQLAAQGMPKRQLVEALVAGGFIIAQDESEREAIALEWEAGADASQDIERMRQGAGGLPQAA
jgi:hypothetical protein